ncbi:MAG: glycogen synthase GlgA [Pseudomonadota bacterium]
MKEVKVLFATSEVAPLIKTGGLADVSSALPAALRGIGVDARVLVPGYAPVMAQLTDYKEVITLDKWAGFPVSRLLSATMENGVPLLVLECPYLYQRAGSPYQDENGQDWDDNPLRFGLLSKVAAMLGSRETPLPWHPDVVHCNDWQTGLAAAYLHFTPAAAATVMTIHNMAFQGSFGAEWMQALQLPGTSFSINGLELYGKLSFLKAGLYYANHITTVSPTYANEIQQPELGFGLQGLLRSRNHELTGILNGIDTVEWNPASDKHLASRYSVGRMAGKAANKRALQSKMGLHLDADVPLLGVVSRLTYQKGLDLLLEIAPRLTELPVQLVILGSGDAAMQQTVRDLSHRYPGKIGAMVGFDEALSHQIEAGADIFVMPSRFEPCGLNQFYSQCYGTPPIVHATGGLADSVVDCNEQTLGDGTASGFVFEGMTADNLLATIERALGVYHQPRNWKALRKNCMKKDFDWRASALAYREIYQRVSGRV